MEIGLTPLPLFVFICFLKERIPLSPPRWTMDPLFKKKSKKHIDVKRKNKEEMEGIHDNASAIIHLNMKTHK